MNTSIRSLQPMAYLFSGLRRGISFALGWILLTEGVLKDAWLGGIIVTLATLSSFLVLGPGTAASLRPIGILRYLWFFAVYSIKGGLDVSLRALRPSLPLSPAFRTLELDMEPEGLRILFAWTVSLLPGTASVHLEENTIIVHLISAFSDAEEELLHLEAVVRGLSRT